MIVIFFSVDGILNYPGSEAKAPDGSLGIADSAVKELKNVADKKGAKLVLTGSWTKDWDFEDTKCTQRGTYLNKKMNRRGLHILDKTDTPKDWLTRHPNVTEYCVLKNWAAIKWEEW